MKKLFTLLFVLMIFTLNAQQLKTQTQQYKDGIATFQYYENSETLELTKHGTFKFVENLKGKYGTWSVLVTGNFKQGLRNGIWTYKITQVDAEDVYGEYITGTLTSTQNFKNGFPDGIWTYANSRKSRPLIWTSSGYKLGTFGKLTTESANLNFKNGRAVGVVKYVINGVSRTITLNSLGIITQKELMFNSNGITKGMYFCKGTLIRSFERINETGTIMNDKIFDSIANTNMYIDTIGLHIKDLSEMFENDYFTLWGGDLTFKDESFYRNYTSCYIVRKKE